MFPEIKIISKKLNSIGKKLYIVGGFCREKILGENNETDIDLVTDATPNEFERVLDIAGEIGKKYGTCIVKEGKKSYELTTFRKDIGSVSQRKPAEVKFTTSLKLDARRRDFTCNSIYFDVESEKFIDPNNGIKDIENKILRFVGETESRINEDILRILRAIRFKNKYNFSYANTNYKNIFKKNIKTLENLSIERTKQELDKMFLDKSNVNSILELKEIGFLNIFIPELEKLEEVPGNKHHLEGNVFLHTIMCLEELNKIIQKSNLKNETKLDLIWSILLHDIGKKQTLSFSIKDNDNHYYEHEEVSAKLFIENIAERFLFSNNSKKVIYYLIKNHLRLFKIFEMRKLKARRFMMEDYFEYLLLIGEADSLGKIPQKNNEINEIKKYYKEFLEKLEKKTFLTGTDIMVKYPDLRGNKIGQKLKDLNDQILIND